MQNYFEQAKVEWNLWNPESIIFKSNSLTKKILPQENVLSYKSKGDRDTKMAKLTKGKAYTSQIGNTWHSQDNHVAVHVELKQLKSEYIDANLEFVDYSERFDSVGNRLQRISALVYIQSHHSNFEWKRDANGNYSKVKQGQSCGLDEGYRICYGGQGDSNPLSFREFNELLQISESIRKFVVDVAMPYREGNISVIDQFSRSPYSLASSPF